MSTLQFHVVAGPDVDRTFLLEEGTGQILGRSQDARYRLTDPHCSRMHCELRCEGDRVTVLDNGSASGTFVNGQRIEEKVLKPGDLLKLGETTLRLEVAGMGEASTIGPDRKADLDPRAVEELSELSGRSLAHYEIGQVLGRSDTGLVFRATDQNDGRTVALKVMPPSFSEDEAEMQRFVRAMKTMLPLEHPNLVRVYAAGKNGPYCWIAMELVEGESLTKVIARIGVAGMLDWQYAFRVAVHIGRALQYAHEQHIIHRNIMPANILIRAEDKVAKLGDLMLAKAMEGALAKQITKPGELLGDVHYMSPERARGSSEIDHRSDLYSLGATVYAVLTGKPPFVGSTLIDTIQKIRTAEPAKPRTVQMGINSAFEGAVLKLLAKEPASRYQSAAELVAELERIATFGGVKV